MFSTRKINNEQSATKFKHCRNLELSHASKRGHMTHWHRAVGQYHAGLWGLGPIILPVPDNSPPAPLNYVLIRADAHTGGPRLRISCDGSCTQQANASKHTEPLARRPYLPRRGETRVTCQRIRVQQAWPCGLVPPRGQCHSWYSGNSL